MKIWKWTLIIPADQYDHDTPFTQLSTDKKYLLLLMPKTYTFHNINLAMSDLLNIISAIENQHLKTCLIDNLLYFLDTVVWILHLRSLHHSSAATRIRNFPRNMIEYLSVIQWCFRLVFGLLRSHLHLCRLYGYSRTSCLNHWDRKINYL